MKRTFSRLQTIKYLGKRSPEAYIINLTGEAAFKSARARRGALNGIGLISGVSGDSGVIILKPKVLFMGGDNRNDLSGWSGKLINAYQLNSAFGVTGKSGIGLIYDSVTPANTEATISSTWDLKSNEGFVVRMFPYANPDKAAAPSLHNAFQFGKWRLIFYGEKVLLVRINDNWNITSEKAALDNDDDALIGPRSFNPTQNASAIYDVYQELDSPERSQSIIGDFYEVWILPEPNSGLHISIGAQGFDSADNQTFVPLPENETGDIYNASPLTVYTRSNALFFQIGTMSFKSGALVVGPLSTPYSATTWDDSFLNSNISYNVRKNTPPGTSATVSHEIINDAYFQFKVNLATTDSAYTPFVYWAQAALQGGAYVGDTQFQIDTDDLLDAQHNSPIVDIESSCDGDMRRRSYEITLRRADKIQTKLFEYNGNPQSFMLENQLATLSTGGAYNVLTPLLTNGLITHCEAQDAANIEHTSTTNGFHRWTFMTVRLEDAWAILENDIITSEITGDGMYLGDYVKHLLIDGGFSLSQININDTAGRILPQAAYGENPCVMPREEQTRADYLRELFDLYGLNWQLYVDNHGIWQMRQRPTTIAQIGGVNAVFSTDPARNSATTYPGRFAILSSLDWVRDVTDFYNKFRVEGAEVRGVRLCQEYINHRSIRGIVNTDNTNDYIGYERPFGTVRNDGLRTNNEVQLALRSLVMRYGVSARFLVFDSYFHDAFFQWDRVMVQDAGGTPKPYAIWRNPGGSLTNDRMNFQLIQL